MVLQETQHSDKLSRPFPLTLRFALQATVEDLEALGEFDVGRGSA